MRSEQVFFVCLAATICWLAHVIGDTIKRRQQLQITADFHNRLLERTGAVRDFGEFLTSDAGSRFLESITPAASPGLAELRILRSIQAGIILLCLSGGLFAYAWLSYDEYWRGDDALSFFAAVSGTVGLGLLISAAVSFKLSQRLGLIERPRPAPRATNVTPSV